MTWKARRRYPRGLKVPIPIEASYGVPFLVEGGPGVGPSSLEWSHRILGAERAGPGGALALAGPGLARFEVDPSDFATLGPHRLALAAKVRVVGLTDTWEIELPHLPFSFEFDPILAVEALLTTEDDPRADGLRPLDPARSRPRRPNRLAPPRPRRRPGPPRPARPGR